MRARTAGEAAVCGLAFAGLAYVFHGYVFGHASNHAFYLPYVFARLDPSTYPGDFAVAGLKAGMPTVFWDLLTLLSRPLGVEAAAALLWWGSRVAAGAATWAAARALGAGRRGAWLAALFCACSGSLFDASPLAGDPMLKASIDQTSFAWPLVLSCVAAWLAEKPVWAFGGLGVCLWLNPMLALLGAFWILLWGLLERRGGLMWPARLFLFMAAPATWWLRLQGAGDGDEALMKAVSSQTFLASSWPPEKWLVAGVWAALAGWLLRDAERRARLGPGLFAVVPIWLFLPAQFQPYRLDVAVIWLLLIALAVDVEDDARLWPALAAAAALSGIWNRPLPLPPDPLAEAAAWARTRPAGESFIVRPEASGFRLASRHPVYAEWADFNLALWDAKRAAEWKRRMSLLGVDWETFPKTLAAQQRAWEAAVVLGRRAPLPDAPPAWTPRGIIPAAADSGATYLVAPGSLTLPWPVAWSKPGVTIYSIPR